MGGWEFGRGNYTAVSRGAVGFWIFAIVRRFGESQRWSVSSLDERRRTSNTQRGNQTLCLLTKLSDLFPQYRTTYDGKFCPIRE
jgi:hypothetical protein